EEVVHQHAQGFRKAAFALLLLARRAHRPFVFSLQHQGPSFSASPSPADGTGKAKNILAFQPVASTRGTGKCRRRPVVPGTYVAAHTVTCNQGRRHHAELLRTADMTTNACAIGYSSVMVTSIRASWPSGIRAC